MMDVLIKRMSTEEKDLVARTYVLDKNSLDKEDIPAPEYVLTEPSVKLKTKEANQIFAVLHSAVAREYGQVHKIPR